MKLALVLTLACAACQQATTSTPAPAPPPSAVSSPAQAACSNLLALGCPEGQSTVCASTFAAVVAADAGFSDPNLPCLAAAKSAAAARACSPGFVACAGR